MVGEPIPVADLLHAARAEAWPTDRLHTAVAARVSHHLRDLTARLDARRAGLPDPGPSAAPDAGAAVSSLDQFDPSDLLLAAAAAERRRAGRGVWAAWERVKFRSALERPGGGSWATQGVAAGAAQQQTQQTRMQVAPPGSAVLTGCGGNGSVSAAAGAAAGAAPLMTGASPVLRDLLGWRQGAAAGLVGLGAMYGAGGAGVRRSWLAREELAQGMAGSVASENAAAA